MMTSDNAEMAMEWHIPEKIFQFPLELFLFSVRECGLRFRDIATLK